MFRVNSCLSDHKYFKGFVEKIWKSFKVKGKPFVLKEKFKLLRMWNMEVFGWLDLKVDQAIKDLNEINEVLLIDEPLIRT